VTIQNQQVESKILKSFIINEIRKLLSEDMNEYTRNDGVEFKIGDNIAFDSQYGGRKMARIISIRKEPSGIVYARAGTVPRVNLDSKKTNHYRGMGIGKTGL